MTMTADQLMALVKQYVEACEALGLRRFDRHRDEDFKAARWEVVDGWRQIEAEVARLHAEATKADRLRAVLRGSDGSAAEYPPSPRRLSQDQNLPTR